MSTPQLQTSPEKVPNPLRFPSDIEFGRPTVVFRVTKGGPQIMLPIPAGVTFNDAGEYSSIELGQIGGGVGEQIGKRGTGVKGLINEVISTKAADVGRIAAQLAAGGAFGDTAQKAAFLSTSGKKILNPNTNTTFSTNSIRQFTFAFKLIGRSEKDSKTIRDIHNTFRANLYPKSSFDNANVILDYPPIWTIEFEGRNVNEYLPYIYPCYLDTLTTSFNSSANMYRTDGAPVEVDVSITFRETRALIRNDIETLAAGKPRPTFDL
jgi:hypothetical protein